MLRKAFITGLLMFFNKGSLFQLVVAQAFCLAFLFAATWFRPFVSSVANLFKVGTEVALLMTLNLVALLKIDLSKEDVPGGEDFVGLLLLVSNVALPGASFVVGIWGFGFDAQQVVSERKIDEIANGVEFDENPMVEETKN